MKTNGVEITTKQAALFDECVAELSAEAQSYFAAQVPVIAAGMADGGGVKSAKALLLQLMRFCDKYEIDTATLLTRQ